MSDSEPRQVYETGFTGTVNETSAVPYLLNTIEWLPRLRIVAGCRADQFWYGVSSDNPASFGNGTDYIVSPKCRVVMSPAAKTKVFLRWAVAIMATTCAV